MNNTKKYTVKDFIKKYNELTSDELKEKLIKSIMNIHYVPYETKVTVCSQIVDKTYYIKTKRRETEVKKFHVNSPANYMLFCLNIVEYYTNLKVNFKDCVNEFNTLNGCEVLDLIYNNIPEREIKEFRMILDMIENDTIQNEYEPHAFIANQVERFGELIGTSLKPAIDELNKSIKSVDKNSVNDIVSNIFEKLKK